MRGSTSRGVGGYTESKQSKKEARIRGKKSWNTALVSGRFKRRNSRNNTASCHFKDHQYICLLILWLIITMNHAKEFFNLLNHPEIQSYTIVQDWVSVVKHLSLYQYSLFYTNVTCFPVFLLSPTLTLWQVLYFFLFSF